MNYPVAFDKFTDDELERAQLEGTYSEPTSQSDPHHKELQGLVAQLATYARSMPQKHRRIVEMYFRGATKQQIIAELGTSYPTISKALQSSRGLRLLSLLGQISEMRSGPSQEARRALLWRIALRTEESNPRVSSQAVDILNRQAGDYQSNLDEQEAGLRVTVKEFVLNVLPSPDGPTQPAQPAPTPTSTVIEGEFTPVTVPVDA